MAEAALQADLSPTLPVGAAEYAQAVLRVREAMAALQAHRALDDARALETVRALVGLCEEGVDLLPLTRVRCDEDYLAFHQANVCVLAIAFGARLGLTQEQLTQLGLAALLHDVGLACVPAPTLAKKTALTPAELAQILQSPLFTIRGLLRSGLTGGAALTRVVATFEHKQEYGVGVRDAFGNIERVVPREGLSVFARIIAICDTYDALTSKRPFREAATHREALALLWEKIRHKFDPELLRAFLKMMDRVPAGT